LDEPALFWPSTQEKVLSYRHFRDQGQFLGDQGDAFFFRVFQGFEVDEFAIEQDFPAERPGRVIAAKDLDERAFPGTVLAAEGVDLAGLKVKGNTVQGFDPGEFFGDVF
jgi:hypothetical protein